MAFTKATKSQARLRLALCGPAGSGKTYTALALARGLGTRCAVICTERGSAAKYADEFDFDMDILAEDQSPEAYVKAISAAERGGYEVLIIDSLTHAWSGAKGTLQQVDDAKVKTKNQWTAWRTPSKGHSKLIDKILSCKCHVIATMRVKMEHAQEKDERGKTVVRKIGLAPIMRDGVEYEFDVVGDIDIDHVLTVSKTRCRALADTTIWHKPGEELSAVLKDWLSDGASVSDQGPPQESSQEAIPPASSQSGSNGEAPYPDTHVDTEITQGELRQCLKNWCATTGKGKEEAVAKFMPGRTLRTLTRTHYPEVIAAISADLAEPRATDMFQGQDINA